MTDDTDSSKGKAGPRVGCFVGGILLLLVILVLLLPTILSFGPVTQMVIGKIDAAIDGELSVDSVSLGWLKGQELEGVSFKDPQGQLSANMESVSVSSGLLGLLSGDKDLGDVVVSRPKLTYTPPPVDRGSAPSERKTGSREEAPLEQKSRPAPGPPPEPFRPAFDVMANVQIRDASVTILPEPGATPNTRVGANVEVRCESLHQPIRFTAGVADLLGASDAAAPVLTLEGQIDLLSDGVLDPGSIRVESDLQADGFDLRSLAPIAAFVPQMPELEGTVFGEFRCEVDSKQRAVEGAMSFESLMVASPALKTDRPSLESAEVEMNVTIASGNLSIRELKLTSQLVTMSLVGDAGFSSFGSLKPGSQLTAAGEVDVAELSRQFPATLGLREGLRLTGGDFNLIGHLKSASGGLRMDGGFSLAKVAGEVDGQAFRLSAPVDCSITAVQGGGGPVLEMLQLRSAHGSINGRGDLTSAVVNAEFNLGGLAGEIGQVIDLRGLEAGGDLKLNAQMVTAEGDRREISADIEATGLAAGGLAAHLKNEAVPDASLDLSGIVEVTLDGKTLESVNLGLTAEHLTLQGGCFKSPAPPLNSLRVDAHIGFEGSKIGISGLRLQSDLLTASSLGEVEKVLTGVDGTLDFDLSLDEAMLLDYLLAAGFVKKPAPLDGKLALKAGVRMVGETISLESVSVNSDAVGLSGKGELQGFKSTKQVSLDGRLRLDYEELAQLSEALSGYRPDVKGESEESLSLTASLADPQWMSVVRSMNAEGALALPYYKAFGLAVTNLDVRLGVADARASMSVDTEVNEGTLKVEPFLDVSAEHAVVGVPDASEVMSGVKLTDELASELLGLIHPVFRGCAILGGEMGLRLDRCKVPVDKARHDDAIIEGEIVLQNVLLSPGGMLAKIVELAKIRDAAIEVPEQRITFECIDGRIHPSPLEIALDEATLVVKGSVGLDQTVSYVCQVPVTKKLVGREVYPYLEGESLELKIGGTISQPDLGSRTFTRAVADLVKKAGKKAIVNEGLKLLDGFLGQ